MCSPRRTTARGLPRWFLTPGGLEMSFLGSTAGGWLWVRFRGMREPDSRDLPGSERWLGTGHLGHWMGREWQGHGTGWAPGGPVPGLLQASARAPQSLWLGAQDDGSDCFPRPRSTVLAVFLASKARKDCNPGRVQETRQVRGLGKQFEQLSRGPHTHWQMTTTGQEAGLSATTRQLMSLRIQEHRWGPGSSQTGGLVWGPKGGGRGPLSPSRVWIWPCRGGSKVKDTSRVRRGDTCRHRVTIQHSERVLPEEGWAWPEKRRKGKRPPQGEG